MDVSTHAIAALATPLGRAALSVIRLSGDGAHDIFASIIGERERFKRNPARQIDIYTIVDDDPYISGKHGSKIDNPSLDNNGLGVFENIIDEITAIKYSAPRSFTGEDMVEIIAHGGSVIPQKILDRLFRAGARAASRGEFSRRAFLNGKMNLLKAESIVGLIESQTEKHLKSAQFAYQGKQLEMLEKLKRGIIDVLSDIESRIEFDESGDVAESLLTETMLLNKRKIGAIIDNLEEELRKSDGVRAIDNGVVVVIAGPPNAGKSSLFNEILGYDRSIVHDRPGTTRDAVSEKIIIEGVTVKLIDSAGIRETSDVVEQCGIERTMFAVKEAHLIFWVTSADTPLGDTERDGIITNRDKVLVVINKIDLGFSEDKRRFCEEDDLKYVDISLTEKINTETLFETIKSAIREISASIPVSEIIINERHRGIIASIVLELKNGADQLDREEIFAHYLKKALDLTAEFLGYVDRDEVLNEIFGKFCIGK